MKNFISCQSDHGTMNVSQFTGFEKFCGSTFWNDSVTWNTSHPDFTPCFQETVIIWIPCVILWLVLPFYAQYMSTLVCSQSHRSKLFTCKMVVCICLVLISFCDFVKGVFDVTNEQSPTVFIVTPLIQLVTFGLSAALVHFERRKALIASAVQFLFYLLLVVVWIVPFHSYIYRATTNGVEDIDKYHMTSFFITYSLVAIQFILFWFADNLPASMSSDRREQCPAVTASYPSHLFFCWMNGLLVKGYKKNLVEGDVWQPHPEVTTAECAPKLERAWRKEVKLAAYKNQQELLARQFSADDVDERSPLLSGPRNTASVAPVANLVKTKKPSFVRALGRVHGFLLLEVQLLKLLCDLLVFAGPILQKQLISFVENDLELWKGYVFAVSLFVSSLLSSLLFHQLTQIAITLGIRVKAAAVAMVYKKALTMSNNARKTTTTGEIVNLMSVDAMRIQEATGHLWMVWSGPVTIIIALILVWQLLGISVLAGVVVMVILVPLNAYIAGLSRKLQVTQMRLKDQRIKLTNEVLCGIKLACNTCLIVSNLSSREQSKVLKLQAWELSFQDKINAIRAKELDTLKKTSLLGAVSTFTWTSAPFLMTLATFLTYTLTGNTLDATKAFTALSLFNITKFPMSQLPTMISFMVNAGVSLKRIGSFLQADDIDEANVSHDPRSDGAVVISNGTFSWGRSDQDRVVLRRINVHVSDGSLTAVVGQVGCGKSSLMSAVLGEMELISGKVNVRGRVAYVAQQAWIQNASVRENILFGKPYDEERYNEVIQACALIPDLQVLPAGDDTEIGEKGINLSGGQKQRVSLARAVYQDCDVYLLDDPLSAVDSHVGKHIFEQVISSKTGLLKNKTRILVTHGLQWLPQVDVVLVVVNGEITESGSYDELQQRDGPFAQFLKNYLQQQDEVSSDDDDANAAAAELDDQLQRVKPKSDVTSGGLSSSDATGLTARIRKRSHHQGEKQVTESNRVKKPAAGGGNNRLTTEETAATGEVSIQMYIFYAKSVGATFAVFLLIVCLLSQAASLWSSIWLSQWTDDKLLKNSSLSNSTEYKDRQNYYLGGYGGLNGVQAFLVLMYAMMFAVANVRSSGVLHRNMLVNILRSPMVFFETTPIGRILNRFSRDVEVIDNVLPQQMRNWLQTVLTALSTVIIISYSTPVFLAAVLPLFAVYYFVQRFYIRTSRQLKRIESVTRSPIYVHFSETITGRSTIRAYQQQQRFLDRSAYLVDHNTVFYYATMSSNRWLGCRLELLGAIVVLAAAIFAVVFRGVISPGLVGLSITYALQITGALNWIVRMSTDLETNIVSVERISEYCQTEPEADWHRGRIAIPASWPSRGQISFTDYATRYRADLDLVLNGISANIEAGEKIGIVGRTGAGKSSMTLALFRIIEAARGSITIDGLNLADMALYPMRSRLVILPQDPVLFAGSLRMNLDPLEKYSDNEVWRALELAHLRGFVQSLPQRLQYECGESGHNLSVGQRQLVCLARALLRKTKILILDEATAAVDLETDKLIQNTIQKEFADCTVLTVAHRLHTVMDSDRVMVLDSGAIREFDKPETLLQNKNSMFYSLAKDAGLV